MLKIWFMWNWIEIWIEELVDGHQTVRYQPGVLFQWGGHLYGDHPLWWCSQPILVLTMPFKSYLKFHSYSDRIPP